MPFSDFVTPTPEAQFSCALNLFAPGLGTMASSYYNKGGVCMKTFGIGFATMFLFMFFCVWWFWIPFSTPLILIVWLFAQFHSYMTWKASRETYNC